MHDHNRIVIIVKSGTRSLHIVHMTTLGQGTTTTSASGRMPPSTIGRRRWPAWESSPRSLPTWRTIAWWVSGRRICELAVTISSPWWRNRLSCTIPPLPRLWTILRFGRIQCTSGCRIAAMETFNTVPLGKLHQNVLETMVYVSILCETYEILWIFTGRTPYGKW